MSSCFTACSIQKPAVMMWYERAGASIINIVSMLAFYAYRLR